MMQAVSPYSGGSRSKAEILARYRPIAPKPEAPTSPSDDNNALPESIRKSAFLRNTWANYPTGFPQIPMIHRNLAPVKRGIMESPAEEPPPPGGRVRGIDLNREAAAEAPEESNFMPPQLQTVIITPHPVRLIGSTVFVGCIIHSDPPAPAPASLKTAEDVESEAEAVALPVLVSDVNNKVRLANSAYKEMVGQPECRWLDRLPPFQSPCKRICGEVAIQFSDSCNLPVSSNRFTCWVRMEWSNNGKKTTVGAFCDAVKLACQSKDYLFQWRFHTSDHSSKSAS
nr:translation initiation factor IF-2-like [Ipomoea batatas]